MKILQEKCWEIDSVCDNDVRWEINESADQVREIGAAISGERASDCTKRR